VFLPTNIHNQNLRHSHNFIRHNYVCIIWCLHWYLANILKQRKLQQSQKYLKNSFSRKTQMIRAKKRKEKAILKVTSTTTTTITSNTKIYRFKIHSWEKYKESIYVIKKHNYNQSMNVKSTPNATSSPTLIFTDTRSNYRRLKAPMRKQTDIVQIIVTAGTSRTGDFQQQQHITEYTERLEVSPNWILNNKT